MSSTAFAVAIPSDYYDHPYKAVFRSSINLAELVFDFMYGTPERARATFVFAIVLSVLGIGMDHAQGMASMRDCPVTNF